MVTKLDRLLFDSLEPLLQQTQLDQSLSLPSPEDRTDSTRCSRSSNSTSSGEFFQKFTDLLRSLSQGTREFFAPLIILFSSRAFNKALNELDLPDN